MSQDVLITGLIKGEPLKPPFVTLSVLSTLIAGGALSWQCGCTSAQRILG